MNDIRKVLCFSDVLLRPRYSNLHHLSDADISFTYENCKTTFVSYIEEMNL